jgi:hypothetical protein
MIPLQMHRGNQVVSGEAWRLFKEAYPERDFSNFWLEACLDFSIGSFDLSWFFLQCDDYVPITEASSSQTFMKTDPPSPKTSDYDFAYASDIAENSGRDPAHIVELSYRILDSLMLCNELSTKFCM